MESALTHARGRSRTPPPPRPGIERVTSLRILGVIVNDKLKAADHVTILLSSCSRMLYAMHECAREAYRLRPCTTSAMPPSSHGLSTQSAGVVCDVFSC